MAEAENTIKRDWKKRESLSSALLQIGLVAVLLAGAVYFVYSRGSKKKEAAERVKEARAHMLRDNPKDLQKALAEMDELFKKDATAADGLAIAADIHTELWLVHNVPGAEQKAREFLQKAESADSRTEERYGSKALHLVAEGKAKEAEAYIDDLRKRGASSARLWYAVARANQALGNLALAKQGYNQAVEKAWKDPSFSTGFGEYLIDEGNYLQALEMLTKATNANPEHLRARLDTALVFALRKERVKDASDAVADALSREAELTPGLKARALVVKAELASFEGKYDDAVAIAGEALTANPDEHLALIAKARALALKKDAGAADAFKAAVAKNKMVPAAYFEGATLLQQAGNPDGALALLGEYENTFRDVKGTTADGKVVGALDRDDKYWLTRGNVLQAAGKLDEAMAAYEKAVAAENVNLVRAHYAKASVYLAKKEFDAAKKSLEDITPPDGSGTLAEAYLAMGEVMFASKDYASGCQNFAFALAKYKSQQAPRERLNQILDDVNKRLVSAGQGAMAKAWMAEAKPIIQ